MIFWTTYLKVISLFFAFLGILWAVIGSFDPFGIYDSMMAQSFYQQDQLPADVKKATQFILAPFGATSAGYFILQYLITVHAFSKKEKWAWQTIFGAFTFWFLLDSTLSIYHGAWFNLLLANIPALLLTLPVMIFSRKYFY